MIVMAITFWVVYSKTISCVGFEYKDAILVPSQENGSTVYSGKIGGQQASFTVSEDKTVVFQYGDKTYGPYSVTSDGVERARKGNAMDPMEPPDYIILRLADGPELTHKGEWFVWFCTVFVCILNALWILFADELFYRDLKYRIRNAEQAEPSDWEIVSRYIGWTALTVMAFVLFIQGLR